MRARQYGHGRGKRRGYQNSLFGDAVPEGGTRLYASGFAHSGGFSAKGYYNPKHQTAPAGRAKAAKAHNSVIALYGPPSSRVKYTEQKHTKITLKLWHKSAMREGELVAKLQGPVISKRYTGS